MPLNEHELTSDKVFTSPDAYRGLLAKLYGSLLLSGQQGPGGASDVAGIDEGYSSYTRALLYLQEATTDIILFHSGSGVGTRDLLFTNWHPGTDIIKYAYYRLFISINYCNEMLREISDERLRSRELYEQMKDIAPYYRAEARFIRAYAYMMLCDLYGSVPFVDENTRLGSMPQQKTREEIFNFAVSEAEAAAAALMAPGTNEYGRIDQVAGWFLLSRLYLNARTWVGKNEYEKAYQYAKKVIDSGKYPLAPDYRYIFLADNETVTEMIWALPHHLENTKSWGGTNFLIKALCDGNMREFTGMTEAWGNARLKTQFVDMFKPSDQPFDADDPWGDDKMDKRAQLYSGRVINGNPVFHTKETWAPGQPLSNTFQLGYASLKWRNMSRDRKLVGPGGTQTLYSAIDFPMFRTADAYLMAAEAILRGAGGSRVEALGYVNKIRDRAYLYGDFTAPTSSGVSGRITDAELTLDFILDERARELHLENVRRTDLVRFGKFTKGYNWDWKGSNGAANNQIGRDVDDKFNLFPIPEADITANPNLTQNPDFR
jgi:hypothetical protein